MAVNRDQLFANWRRSVKAAIAGEADLASFPDGIGFASQLRTASRLRFELLVIRQNHKTVWP